MLAVLSKFRGQVLHRGAWAMLLGVAAVAGRKDDQDQRLLHLQDGAGIAFRVLTLHAPAITAGALVRFVAAWARTLGGAPVVLSFRARVLAAKAAA